MATLSKIIVYPIKALPGVQVDAVTITEGGTLKNDRRWALTNRKGRLLNGKNNKRVFSLNPVYNLITETVYFSETAQNDTVFNLDDVDGLSDYFTQKLGKPVFLKEDKRQGFPDDMNATGPTVVSQASLDVVSSWYPSLSISDVRERFRINIEVSAVPAFWEDKLFQCNQMPETLRIGGVSIQTTNSCARCSVPAKHPESGEPYTQFYETFIKMREKTCPEWADKTHFDHWYRFGVNTQISLSEAALVLKVGDKVAISN
jgi:hypothetical protein